MTAGCLASKKMSVSAALKPSEGLGEPRDREGVLGRCLLSVAMLWPTLSSCDCLNRASKKDRQEEMGEGRERKKKRKKRRKEEKRKKRREREIDTKDFVIHLQREGRACPNLRDT